MLQIGSTVAIATIAGRYWSVSWDPSEASRRRLDEIQTLLARGAYGDAETRARALYDAMVASAAAESFDIGDLLVEASLANGRGASNETRRIAEDVLRSRETSFGIDHPLTAPSLLNLGDVLVEAAELEDGVAFLRRGVAALERTEP